MVGDLSRFAALTGASSHCLRFSDAPSMGRPITNRHRIPSVGESPGGVAPSGARRTRREPLSSPGSHRPAVGARAQSAAREQARLASVDGGQEPARLGGMAAQPFVSPHGPTNEVVVDPSEKPDQVGAVEAPVEVLRMLRLSASKKIRSNGPSSCDSVSSARPRAGPRRPPRRRGRGCRARPRRSAGRLRA